MAIYRLFILLLAAAFIFSGSAVHASLMLPAVLQDHHAQVAAAPDAHQGYAAHQDHGGDHAGVAAAEHQHAQPQEIDHGDNCLKCCSMCGVDTIAADQRGAPVTCAYGTVRFHIGQRYMFGDFVALDPDIPKSIV